MSARPLSRRDLLRGLVALGGAGLLAACGRGGGEGGEDGDTRADGGNGVGDGATTPAGDVREQIRSELGIEEPLDLSVIVPAPLLFTAIRERVLFGLGTSPTDFRADLDIEAWLVRDDDLEVVHGPVQATYHDEGLEGLGIYLVEVEISEPGAYWLAARGDGHAAVGAVQFMPQSATGLPALGEPFPSAPTPTTDDPMGLEDICTDEPPCPMHEVSLAQALEAGRPVVLTVATPAYCQTAVCGPVVDVIEQVRADVGRDDVAWIHSEVYSDAGNTPVPLVTETLQLPSEPWTFFVGADGTLVDRLQGPTPADLVREAVERI